MPDPLPAIGEEIPVGLRPPLPPLGGEVSAAPAPPGGPRLAPPGPDEPVTLAELMANPREAIGRMGGILKKDVSDPKLWLGLAASYFGPKVFSRAAPMVARAARSMAEPVTATATQLTRRIGIDPAAMERQTAVNELAATRMRLQAARSKTRQAGIQQDIQQATAQPEATMPVASPPAPAREAIVGPAGSQAGPAGTVRLYRGESASSTPGAQAGQTFTDNPLDALYYAKQGGGTGRLMYVDLPAEEAAQYKTADPTGQGVHLLPPTVAASARQNVIGGPSAPAGEAIAVPPGPSPGAAAEALQASPSFAGLPTEAEVAATVAGKAGPSDLRRRAAQAAGAPARSALGQMWEAKEAAGVTLSAKQMQEGANRVRRGESAASVVKELATRRDATTAEALIMKYTEPE